MNDVMINKISYEYGHYKYKMLPICCARLLAFPRCVAFVFIFSIYVDEYYFDKIYYLSIDGILYGGMGAIVWRQAGPN